jgi:hypothetical protein
MFPGGLEGKRLGMHTELLADTGVSEVGKRALVKARRRPLV